MDLNRPTGVRGTDEERDRSMGDEAKKTSKKNSLGKCNGAVQQRGPRKEPPAITN